MVELQNKAQPTGLEPVTGRLEIYCSIQLSYGCKMADDAGDDPATACAATVFKTGP